MTARRQSSTTSLSKYANFGRTGSPPANASTLDFCNAFWGLGDGGVDVLFARLRGAMRTVDELRAYWKERASIEDDYARRMAKLAKMVVGRDEIGEMRNSIDTLREETDRQASYHQTLANQLKNDMEGPTSAFYARQSHHKKTLQSHIEKEFKSKQTQESYVFKAREKYEQDCMRINSYTAQSSLVQGKDLEKVNLKLERAQQTVHANERDFANFSRALSESTVKWEKDWKAFCDSAQDLEEDRLEFMKDVMWTYANGISTVCVSDDESCEKMRLALEQMAYDVEMENFVRDYGTGQDIPDPPAFVNYTAPEAIPSSQARPTARPAHFVRVSQRRRDEPQPTRQERPAPSPEPEEPPANMVGVGALGKRASQIESQQQPLSRKSTTRSMRSVKRQSTIPTDANGEPMDPSADTYIKVGGSAYKVDLSRDPTNQLPPAQQPSPSPSKFDKTGGVDPLARQLEELRRTATTTGTLRKNSTMANGSSPSPGIPPSTSRAGSPTKQHHHNVSSSSALSLPPGSAPSNRDYRNSAELVVGSLPSSVANPSQSRPASPSVPTPVFMQPPRSTPSPSHDQIDSTLSGYHQAFPGEKRRSRSPSVISQNQHQPQQASLGGGQDPERVGRRPSIGHAGVGAHGRSTSRSPSPAPPGPPPQQQQPPPQLQPGMRPPSGFGQQRATSPSVGIALDPSGRVLVDEMASRFQQQPPPQQQQQQQHQARQPSYSRPGSQMGYVPPAPQQAPPAPQQQQQARRTSYVGGPPPQQQPPPSNAIVPAGQSYQQPYHAQQGSFGSTYGGPPPQQQPSYQAPPPQQQGYQQPPPSQINGGYYQQPPPQQQAQPYQHQQQLSYGGQGQGGYGGQRSRSPSVGAPPPQQQQQQGGQVVNVQSGALTGQTTQDGTPILFYVKALYDYTATIDEEFDFQAGDVIAVTATPDDGWWSGELLDEKRRVRGRHVFPSNFVCLF